MWLRLSIVIVAFALASCGDDADESGAGQTRAGESSGGLEAAEPVALPEGSTPRAKYVKQVNDICALEGSGITAEIERAVAEEFSGGQSNAEAFTRAMADVFPLIEKHYQRIYSIPPPPGDREDLERFWGYAQKAFEASNDYFAAYEAGDTERMAEASKALHRQESANAFAKSYGIRDCTGFTDSEATQLGTELERDPPGK